MYYILKLENNPYLGFLRENFKLNWVCDVIVILINLYLGQKLGILNIKCINRIE